MKVKLKEKINGRWKQIKIEKLMSSSIVDYMLKSSHSCVGAVYDNEEEQPILMLTNNEEMKSYYSEKDFLVITATELAFLVGSVPVNKLSATVFKDSEFVSLALTGELDI